MQQLKKLFGIGESVGQLEENTIEKPERTELDGLQDSKTAYDVIAKIAGLIPYGDDGYTDGNGRVFVRCKLGFKPVVQYNLGLKLQEQKRLREELEDKLKFTNARMEYVDNKLVGVTQSKDKQIEVLNTENLGLRRQIKQLNHQLNNFKQAHTSIVKTLTKLYENMEREEEEKHDL